MDIAVLGGLGLQGKAVLYDLSRDSFVNRIICADVNSKELESLSGWMDVSRIEFVELDASSKDAIVSVLSGNADVAVDMLPFPLMKNAFEASIAAGVPLVSTNYGDTIRHLDEEAKSAGIALMPECGLDPGIDLVLCGNAVRRFDEVHVINSYCGGIPEKKACDNPLNYKVSWNWDMVIQSQKRDSVFIKDGIPVEVRAKDQHDSKMAHRIDFPGLGQLEAVPNGNAVFYTDLLRITATVKEAGRYSLRWPGWLNLWSAFKKLGLLSEEPVPGLEYPVTPRRFFEKLVEPKIRYKDEEKDLVIMLNEFRGMKNEKPLEITTTLKIERDLSTGLFAMSQGVGYTAAIVARMIVKDMIPYTGVLNPAIHIPCQPFLSELKSRGIEIHETTG